MSVLSAELAVGTTLNASGDVALTSGTNLFRGPTRPPKTGVIPTLAVFVVEHGGFKPQPYMGSTAQSWDQPQVEVRIRSGKSDYLGGYQLAQDVWLALHLADPPAGWTWMKCKTSRPRYIGRDEIDNHEWIVDVLLALKETV